MKQISYDRTLRSALHYACSKGHVPIVELILEHDKQKSLLNLKDVTGATPLHRATAIGKVKIMQLLIEKGARVNVQNSAGETPVRLALRFPLLTISYATH